MKGIIFFTRLHERLSHLSEHKFKHSFLDTLISICPCDFDIETLSHFFLHCLLFIDERQILRHKIENINKGILNKTDDWIIHVLLYGDVSFEFTENTSILNASVEYILATKNFKLFIKTVECLLHGANI